MGPQVTGASCCRYPPGRAVNAIYVFYLFVTVLCETCAIVSSKDLLNVICLLFVCLLFSWGCSTISDLQDSFGLASVPKPS